MADVHFSCPGCAQPLVADENGAGLTIDCPHCGKSLQIPVATHDEAEARLSKKLSKWITRANDLEQRLYDAETNLQLSVRESEQRQIALAEALKQLRGMTTERDVLQNEIDAHRADHDMFLGQLRSAQTAALNAQERLEQIETEREHLDLRVQQLELELGHKQKLLDTAHRERNEAVMDLAQKSAALADLSSLLETSRNERSEFETIAQRTRDKLAQVEHQLAELHSAHKQLTANFSTANEELKALRDRAAEAELEREQLRNDVRQDHELASFLAVKQARDHFEAELRDAQAVIADIREKLLGATDERDTLRRETVDLQLKISARRDTDTEATLREDNELLRGIIERLNEELKERPVPTKRQRKQKQEHFGTRIGDLFRALWARCFVSDPDVT